MLPESPTLVAEAPAAVDGRLFALGFALMPNRLGYCGGPDQRELHDYYIAGRADAGLTRLLNRFEGPMPYLRLIATENGLADPLDHRVVEAYWLGNDLLDHTDLGAFYRSLHDRFRSRVSRPALERLLGAVPAGATPSHTFHVLQTYLPTATLPAGFDTLERCRVGWGTVLWSTPQEVTVSARPLVWQQGRLTLGEPAPKTLVRHLDGYTSLPDLKPGEMVAFHWDWLAARITPAQAGRLEQETRRHLAMAAERGPL